MKLFVVLRRQGWQTAADLEEAAQRSRTAGSEMSEDVRWIRSYVVNDAENLGTVCVYQATSEAALRDHAAKAALPSDEVLEVADTVIVRADPVEPKDQVYDESLRHDPLYWSG